MVWLCVSFCWQEREMRDRERQRQRQSSQAFPGARFHETATSRRKQPLKKKRWGGGWRAHRNASGSREGVSMEKGGGTELQWEGGGGSDCSEGSFMAGEKEEGRGITQAED